MNLKLSCLAALSLLLACCSGHSRRASEEAPVTSSNALLPDPGAEATALSSDAVTASAAECSDDQCPALLLLGKPAPGCCQLDGSCGGRVRVSERTQLCVPPSLQESTDLLHSTLSNAAEEPFVQDPACPSGRLDGTTLPGCCRAAGRCGLNTETWTRSAAVFGFGLRAACLDAREAATLLAADVADAGPPQPCNWPE